VPRCRDFIVKGTVEGGCSVTANYTGKAECPEGGEGSTVKLTKVETPK
jgi:hypothetical protein